MMELPELPELVVGRVGVAESKAGGCVLYRTVPYRPYRRRGSARQYTAVLYGTVEALAERGARSAERRATGQRDPA